MYVLMCVIFASLSHSCVRTPAHVDADVCLTAHANYNEITLRCYTAGWIAVNLSALEEKPAAINIG